VASINPVTVLLEAGRGLVSGEPVKLELAFVIAAGLVAAFSAWAVRGLRSAESAA
jgi:ABC-2 type transport system permease protein